MLITLPTWQPEFLERHRLPDRVYHLYLLGEHRQVTGYSEPGGSGV